MSNANSSRKHQPSRDSLSAVNEDGSRFIIHPADVKGSFTGWRKISAYALIVFYAVLPWIEVGGHPAVFLNTEALRFHFFGITFSQQDLWLAFFLVSGLGFGLFYVTALLGRIWCGWACPQTVFLEHVYRRVERWIEGDAVKRRRLDASGMSVERIWKRGLKHVLFVAISLGVAHMFMAYFVSIPGLWNMMHESPLDNWKVFLFVFIFAAILYFNFAWFREQLCIVVCPYGRLQSALIDEHSMVIGYDETRGEPRGKGKNPELGDCVDCNRCVQVCPTGIDIRQGLQMECIGCAACVDACDTVMDKLKRPQGLIRYDSLEGFAGRKTKYIRPRMILYTVLLMIGASVLLFSLSGLSDTSFTTWRAPGPPYYVGDAEVRNQFMVRITNKKNEQRSFRLRVENDSTGISVPGIDASFEIAGTKDIIRPLVIVANRDSYNGTFHIEVMVEDAATNEVVAQRSLEFVGPNPSLLKKSEGKESE